MAELLRWMLDALRARIAWVRLLPNLRQRAATG
jgi:hypothetical protein